MTTLAFLTLTIFADLLITLIAAIIDAKRAICERLERVNRQLSKTWRAA